MALGAETAKNMKIPAVLELIGDVGAGKTTFTRGLAQGLGVKTPLSSPSFTISRAYAFPGGVLNHYDFYRLEDPGLMAEDLVESLDDPKAVTVIEWGQSVENLLPPDRLRLKFDLNEDGSRTVTFLQDKKEEE